MPDKNRQQAQTNFKRFFIRGLATLLPTVLTIVLLVKCFEFVQDHISKHITEGAIRVMVVISDGFADVEYPRIDEATKQEYRVSHHVPPEVALDAGSADYRDMRLWVLRDRWNKLPNSLLGFGLAIILVYIVGRLLASFFGRKLWGLFERTVQQMPGFKQLYPYLKQVTEFLFGENKIEFSRVVLVQYPSKGIWSLGLVTGAGFRHLVDQRKQEFLTLFIPSSPTPVTGYVIHVSKTEVIDLPISIEEALRFTVSGGVIVPGHQELPTQMKELASETTRTDPGAEN